VLKWGTGGINIDACRVGLKLLRHAVVIKFPSVYGTYKTAEESTHQGRFPANLIHDGSQEVLDLFPETKPSRVGKPRGTKKKGLFANSEFNKVGQEHNDSGSAARFFYCPKASKKDRNDGNNHPTVKPTALMAYLCRLITPTGGVVLDPYMGSGSTGKAAVREGFSFVGCELDKDYFQIATARIDGN
jgi:DNA modification methylase